MNLHAMTYFLAAATVFCLGAFVFYKNLKSKTNLSIFLLITSTLLWQIGSGLILLSKDLPLALFYTKIAFIGITFIPISTYHLTLSLLNIKKTKTIILGYLLALFFISILRTPLLLNGVYEYSWGFFFKAGPLHPIFMIFFIYFMVLSFFLTYSNYKKETSFLEKNRRKYFFMAIFIAYIGIVDYIPTYGVNLFPFGSLAVIACIPIFAYAIITYRLNDIEVIIRETAIFAGIFGFSIGLFMFVIAAGEQVLQPYIGQNRWVIPAFSLLLVTFAIRPIEKLVYSVVGKYLFRKKFEYQKTLQDAAEGMSKIRDPKKLLSLIIHIISAKLKLTGVSVLLYDSKQERYRMKASRGNAKDKFINLSPGNPLISWLSEKKKPLTLEEVQKWTSNALGRSSLGVLKSDLLQIKDRMQDLNAAVCVPCFFRDELLGVLVLGEKKSGDFFSQDDLNLFDALSDEAAIALKNSQLYFEIDKKANELEALYKREHRLFMHASIAFAAAIDARDSYTHGHSERVTNISLAILDYIGPAEEVDRNPLFRQRLQIAAVLHDVGKIGVPDEILHKPAKLTPKEEKQMQAHPSVGANVVSHIKGLRDLIGGIKYHHERYDGKGYPEGLKSDEIPFMARIISVADTFDAMTSDRPYRKGLDSMVAREEIQKNAAAQFDPFMVAAFLKAFEEGKIK